MSQQLPTGTVTFLFTDVEGSTALWETDVGMQGALARHDEILRSSIEASGGYVFTTAGDSFAAAFPSVPNAIHAATSAQDVLEAEQWETAGPLRVRMAIHTGTAEQRDGDYFGPALNRAARLLAVGHGGQVLLSQPAASLIEEGSAGTLIDLGEHRLKDLTAAEGVFQLGGTARSFPALRSLDAQAHNLPVQLTSFVGRDKELEEVAALIAEHRLLTLTGVGGSGKTRLALQAAGQVVDSFPDGVWFVELAPVTDPDMLPRSLVDGMGISMGGSASARDRLEAHLADRRLLLILDNCEHLLDDIARLADALLRAAPQLHLLSTSREGLATAGERLWRVPSLPVEAAVGPEESPANRSEAVRLFVERAVQVNPGFAVTAANEADVVAICRRLDGIPLAIELAAAQTRVLPVDVLTDRLDDRFRLLTGGSRTAVPRQRTLLATVEWSYALLSGAEKSLFDRLAAFSGGFTLAACESVCGGDGLDERDVLELLTHLVDKSLVVAPGPGSGRFRMLETLRQFSLDRLAGRGEADQIRRNHAAYFLSLAVDAEPLLETGVMAEWIARLEEEHDNLRAALRWMIDAGESNEALKMATALSVWFWYLRRLHGEAIAWFDQTLAIVDDAPADLLAMAYAKASTHATRADLNERADELAAEAIRRGVAAGSHRAQVIGHWTLGHTAAQGRYDASGARPHFDEALRLAEASEDAIWIIRCLVWIGLGLLEPGTYDEAADHAERALDIARNADWPFGIGNAGLIRAEVAIAKGEFDLAADIAVEAATVITSLGDPMDIVEAYVWLAVTARLQGEPDRGLAFAQEGLGLVSRRTDRVPVAKLNVELAANALRIHAFGQATDAMLAALDDVRGSRFSYTKARVLAGAASILTARNDTERGVTLFAVAASLYEESFDPPRPYLVESEADLAEARAVMGADDFNAAWKRGTSLSSDDAVDKAAAWLRDIDVEPAASSRAD